MTRPSSTHAARKRVEFDKTACFIFHARFSMMPHPQCRQVTMRDIAICRP